jgi:hypothetical protein
MVVVFALIGGTGEFQSNSAAPSPTLSTEASSPSPAMTESNGMVTVSGETPEEQSYLNSAINELDYLIEYSEYNNLTNWQNDLTDIKNDMAAAQNVRSAALSAASATLPTPSPSPTPESSGLLSLTSVGTALAGTIAAVLGLMTAVITWRQAKSKAVGPPNTPMPRVA